MADTVRELLVRISAEDNASSVLRRVSSNVRNMTSSAARGETAFDGMGNAASQNRNKLEAAGKSIKAFGDSVDNVTKPLQAASVAMLGAGVVAAKVSMEYETAFTGVKKTVNGTPEQLARVNTAINEMSKRVPVAAAELANLAAVGGQLGVDIDNIPKFTETIAAMGVATNLAGEDGAATLAQFINVSGESLDNVDRVGSAIVELGNNTATTESDIAHMALRMGKFGKTVKMTSDEVLGYSAALASSGIEAQMGGSAIGRTWLDIQTAVSSNSAELKKYAKYAGTTADAFKKQWNTDSSGAFNGLIKGLSTSKDLTAAMLDLGIKNTQDQQAVMALANNYDLLEKCMSLSSNAYKENTALSNEANAAYSTTANKIQLAKNQVSSAARSFGDLLLPAIANGASAAGSFAEKIANADDNTKQMLITSAKATVITGAAVKGTASLIKGIGGTVEGIAGIKKGIDKVKTLVGSSGVFSMLAGGAAKAATSFAPVGVAIGAVTAVAAAGAVAYKAYEKSTYGFAYSLQEKAEKTKNAFDKLKELDSLKSEYGELTAKSGSGELQGTELENAKRRIEEIKNILSEKYKIDVDSGDIDAAIEKARTLSEIEAFKAKRDLKSELETTSDNYDQAIEKLPQLKQQLAEASAAEEKYLTAQKNILAAQDEFSSGTIDEATYLDRVKISMKDALGEGEKYSQWLRTVKDMAAFNNMSEADVIGQAGLNQTQSMLGGLDIDGLTEKINKYQDAITKYQEAAKGLADINLSQMSDALKSGGDITQYINEIGGLAKNGLVDVSEYASKIALLKNGFSSLGDAASAGQLEAINNEITSLARNWGTLEAGKKIQLDVEGNTSVIDEVTGKIEQIETAGGIDISVNAKGDLSIINEADGKMQALAGMGAAQLTVNAEANVEVLDDAGEKMATIDGTSGEITVNGEYSGSEQIQTAITNQGEVTDKTTALTVNGIYSGQTAIETALSHQGQLASKSVTYTVTYQQIGTPPKQNAKGTQNFSGGLAMVNDQTGISDPRELIIDRGRAFIPQGRNVILPLSRGARVYTAAQTKRIMNAMGIPNYASGKDNSDAFTAASDDWTHYTRSHAVSVTEELKKWNELSKEFTSNQKDVEDIQEKIFSATRNARDELNEASEVYLEERAILNDWEEHGDSMTAAFMRVSDRERQYVKDGIITEKEANDYLKRLGQDMYEDRLENSKAWLEHEVKYNKMSADSYVDGCERMKKAANEAYAAGMLTVAQYNVAVQGIDDMITDKINEANSKEYAAWQKQASEYLTNSDTFGWQNGDNEVEYHKRRMKQIQKFFDEGKIDWETYIYNIKAAYRDLFNTEAEAYDEMLEVQRAYVDSVEGYYQGLIDKKEKAFDMKTLTRDIDEANKKVKSYAGAVTQRGKDVYKEATESLESLMHQRTVKQLQEKQTEVVEKMRADLEAAEQYKKPLLQSLSSAQINIAAIARDIQSDTGNLQGLFRDLIKGIENLNNNRAVTYGATYNINGVADSGLMKYFVSQAKQAVIGG